MENLFFIQKIIWKKDKHYILRCLFHKNNIIVKCHSVLNLNKGDEIYGDYSLEENKDLGKCYSIKLALIHISSNEKESIKFLSKQLSIKESIASKMYDKLGDNYIKYILFNGNVLDDIIKSNKEKERIVSKLEELSFFYQHALILDNVNIDSLIKFYKENKNVKDFNYYMLLKYNANVIDIDNIYQNKNSLTRIMFVLRKYLEDMFRKNGDICIDLNVNNILKQINSYNDKIVITKDNLFKAINERDTYNFFTIYNNCLYLTKNYYIEKDITDNIKLRMIDEDVEEVYIDELSDEQNQALNNALKYNISCIYGSAGTGKTYTIKYITEYLYKNNKTITILAQTGRVADNLRKKINCDIDCSTIHKALNLNEFMKDNELSSIDSDYVIVDEASMININLFKYLFTHIHIDTKIILCGDYNQLPPIGGGQVFRDLYNTNIKKTILTQIFRQSENNSIINNSYKIIEGQHMNDFEKDNSFFYINKNEDNSFEYINSFIKQGNVDIKDVMIISASRLITNQLNALIQNKLNKNKSVHIFNRCFKLNDKVMHVKNNNELKIFNGNIGNIVEINDDKIIVNYDENYVTYTEDNIDELELSYAITIHKSQGSEAKYVFVIIDDSQKNMLNKNMLYTAVTRAKEKVILIGKETTIDKAIDTSIDLKGKSNVVNNLNVII